MSPARHLPRWHLAPLWAALALFALMACLPLDGSAARRRERLFEPRWTPPVPPGTYSFEYLEFDISYWHSSGRALWEKSDPLFDGVPKSEASFGSTLDYQNLQARMILFSAEARPFYRLRFAHRFSFGVSLAADAEVAKGICFDHDWVHVPNGSLTVTRGGVPVRTYEDPDHEDFSLSRSEVTGKTQYAAVNGYFRALETKPEDDEGQIRHSLDVSLGYMWYKDKLRMREGVQLIESHDIIDTPPLGPFGGLDSTYDFRWSGLRLGLRENLHLPYGFSLKGDVAFLPWLEYSGAGYWNLRAGSGAGAFRAGRPNFVHSAMGNGFDMVYALVFAPSDFFSVEAGYKMIYLRATRSGSDQIYFADGSISGMGWDKVRVFRHGLQLSSSLRF